MQEQKPLTPQSVCAEPSPLDSARKQIAELKLEVAQLKRNNQLKTDVRVLDLQTRGLNYKKFLESKGLLTEFNQKYNY